MNETLKRVLQELNPTFDGVSFTEKITEELDFLAVAYNLFDNLPISTSWWMVERKEALVNMMKERQKRWPIQIVVGGKWLLFVLDNLPSALFEIRFHYLDFSVHRNHFLLEFVGRGFDRDFLFFLSSAPNSYYYALDTSLVNQSLLHALTVSYWEKVTEGITQEDHQSLVQEAISCFNLESKFFFLKPFCPEYAKVFYLSRAAQLGKINYEKIYGSATF